MKFKVFGVYWWLLVAILTILFGFLPKIASGQNLEGAGEGFKYWHQFPNIAHRGYTDTYSHTIDSLGHRTVLRDTIDGKSHQFWDLRFEIPKTVIDSLKHGETTNISPPVMTMWFTYPHKTANENVFAKIYVKPVMGYENMLLFNVVGGTAKPINVKGELTVATDRKFMMFVFDYEYKGRKYEVQHYWGDPNGLPWDGYIRHIMMFNQLIRKNK